MEIINRKANFDYFIEDQYEAGVVLTGTEIKSIRNGNCNIKDCYGIVKNGEVFLLNMYIGEYKEGNIFNHDTNRSRKLLLNKKEIKKISQEIELNGLTLIPLKGYFKGSKFKILLGVCRGKKNFDKRETIKNRDIEREVKKKLKNY
ncbi:MAG: SsrA-binding protein SmpB [Bacilli bacterium]|nr:SsrA-binding protein SmpB [Bacilli bacterium]MBR1936104.1 SsrA-binding protein SmpB [Bacilli bacterium]